MLCVLDASADAPLLLVLGTVVTDAIPLGFLLAQVDAADVRGIEETGWDIQVLKRLLACENPHALVGKGLSGWGSGASPIVYKNLLIVNASVESNALVALDKETGKEVWRAPKISSAWGTPVPRRQQAITVAAYRST